MGDCKLLNKINELCKSLNLEKVQSVCPRCSHSYVSVYKLVDEHCDTKLIACYCNKCNHEWVTEDLRVFDNEVISSHYKYVGTIDMEVEYIERPKRILK